MRHPLRISSMVAVALALGAGGALAQADPATPTQEAAPSPAPEESAAAGEAAAAPAEITVGPDEPPAPAPEPTPQPERTPTPSPAATTPDPAPEAGAAAPAPDTDAGSLQTPEAEAPGAQATPPTPEPPPPGGIEAALVCLAPTDSAGLDAALARAGSPLHGHATDFVQHAQAVGLDPRFLVAVAAHETVLMTYGPSRLISNPFGLGPGWSFVGPAEAIETASTVLLDGYLSQGLTTIPAIGAKWAPIGASNDPTDLNSAWPQGVSRFYVALGGDPAGEVLLSAQAALPDCTTSPQPAPAPEPVSPVAPPATDVAPGPVVITKWNGTAPRPLGPGPAGGHDPERGRPATVSGFVFPIAARRSDPIAFRDPRAASGGPGCGVGGLCTVRIEAGDGAPAIASRAGTIARASLPEQEAGIGFWIEPAAGIRVGYGALAAYAEGIAAGTKVRAGDVLGASGEAMTLTLEHGGQRINPYPLLAATRPPGSRREAPRP